MRIKYVGSGDEVEVDLPDGGLARVKRGRLLSLPADLAYGLLQQGPENWQLHDRSAPPDPPAELRAMPASEIARFSITRLRWLRGLTQRQLVERLRTSGVRFSQTQLNRIETGKRRLTLDETLAVAYALNTSPSSLIDGTHYPSPDMLVAITPDLVVPPRRLRGWLRGRDPLHPHRHWEKPTRTNWAREYGHALADEDWLDRQRTTLRHATNATSQLIDALQPVIDHAPDPEREKLADAWDNLVDRLNQLEASFAETPSQRAAIPERRGRPRNPSKTN